MIRIANYYVHKGEEACISKRNGSGVFVFSGCNLRCCYCNIYRSSQMGEGYPVDVQDLSKIFLEYQSQGCNNLNLVNIGKYKSNIIRALLRAKQDGLRIPVVCNSSGYESLDILNDLKGLIDIYLVDFKYGDNLAGLKYSGVADYFDVATRAVYEMYQQVGETVLDDNEVLIKGILVRHLILPGHIENAKQVIDALHHCGFSQKMFLSILGQYMPEYRACEFPELTRRVTDAEYEIVVEYARNKGMRLVW